MATPSSSSAGAAASSSAAPASVQPATAIAAGSGANAADAGVATANSMESARGRYEQALENALARLRLLLASASSRNWKPVQSSTDAASSSTASSSSTMAGAPAATASSSSAAASGKGKARATGDNEMRNGLAHVEPSAVHLHRRSQRGMPDVVRATADIPSRAGEVDLAALRAALQSAEVRNEWDRLVERAQTLEVLDAHTSVQKADYTLGWPASPRDTVTIQRSYLDDETLIDLATSIPPAKDEPAYLRPAPPYVRSHVHLFAWCIQLAPPSLAPPSSSSSPATDAGTTITTSASDTVRITVFWQWSLKGAVFATHHTHVARLICDFVEFARRRASTLALVASYGRYLEISSMAYDRTQEQLNLEYSILSDDELEAKVERATKGPDELARQRERRRLERAIELSLPAQAQGWDVRVRALNALAQEDNDWSVVAESDVAARSSPPRTTIRLTHAAVSGPADFVRVRVAIQRLAAGKLVKCNAKVLDVLRIEPRTPASLARQMLDDTASVMYVPGTADDTSTVGSAEPGSTPTQLIPLSASPSPNASNITVNSALTATTATAAPTAAAAEIMALLRRNYIYFTSLLQEPEAKWRGVSDSRGVTVTQLKSFDPTLTIYRAEANFVGVGVWDVFATIVTPGARAFWDKSIEDAVLLDDISELSSLWHVKTKAAWPVAARDSVTLRTTYKSPSSVHVFAFSTDDTGLFPSIPPVEAPTIRTQTDLHGWAIEALSPTTTQITLLDQSDPKGWSNKSWTPTQMVAAVAGVGDFAIKHGGPPVVTRLLGAKLTLSRYEHEKWTLKTEYLPSRIPPTTLSLAGSEHEDEKAEPSVMPNVATETDHERLRHRKRASTVTPNTIECELRCDLNAWASSLDLVVDPPPLKVTCLSRHRLSSGGGLWVTIEHDVALVGDRRVLVLVRRGSSQREKGSVVVNGARVKVDVEELPEDEVKLLLQRKRVKASPIPLDQYPALGPRVWRSEGRSTAPSPAPASGAGTPSSSQSNMPLSRGGSNKTTALPGTATPPVLATTDVPTSSTVSSSTLTTSARAEETDGSDREALEGPVVGIDPPTPKPPSSPAPSQALEALAWLQQFHAEQGPELADPAPGWAITSERGGTVVRKKLVPGISPTSPVYRGDKILQGLTAEDVASIVVSTSCRKAWDERAETVLPLSSYGFGCTTSVMTTRPMFPFKGRVLHLASVHAQTKVPSASATSSTSTVYFVAAASFDPDLSAFDAAKLNPTGLAPGQVCLEGWILETLDPYASSILAIPSTRCTYISCVEHSGSMSFALNSVLNANPSRIVNAVEGLAKSQGPVPRALTPDASLQIEGPLSDDGSLDCVWKLSNANTNAQLVKTDFAVEDGAFRCLLRIQGSRVSTSPAPATPLKRTRGFTPSTAERQREQSSSGSTATAIGMMELPHKSSSSSLRAAAAAAAMLSTSPNDVKSTSTPKASSMRASAAPTPSDFVAAEFVIDLKQYLHGYSIACSSALISSDEGERLSLDPLTSLASRQVPLKTTVHEAPVPSVLSASLDSSKRSYHLVRILVPTVEITHPVIDPLREERPKAPGWYNSFCESGALVDVRIIPLPKSPKPMLAFDPRQNKTLPTDAKPVMFNGERVEVLSQRMSRGVLARFDDEDASIEGAMISRVTRKRKAGSSLPPPDPSASKLPIELEKPLAISTRLLITAPEDKEVEASSPPDPATPAMLSPPTEGDKADDASSTTGKEGGAELLSSTTSALASPFRNMFGVNAFSRFTLKRRTSSLSTAAPEATAKAGGEPEGNAAPASAALKSRPAPPTIASSAASVATVAAQATAPALAASTAPRYSLTFVLIVAVIAFLLGSLLRSLLTPADYFIYPESFLSDTATSAADKYKMERAIMQAIDPSRRWREARRLFEIRSFFFSKWDLIVAVVRS